MATPAPRIPSPAPHHSRGRRSTKRVTERSTTSASTEPRPEAYGSQAGSYEQRTETFSHWRELLVEKLPVGPGATVLDVGCGTGLCLPLLQDKVGATGTIVGIDESEQMLQVARERVASHGWDNVHLLAAPTASAPIEGTADAALFCAVHDVLQSPAALRNVFDHLHPGAPVAAAGGKQPPLWLWPLRAWVTDLHAPFINDFTGFDRPWRLIAEHLDDLHVDELAFGTGYLALGYVRSHQTPPTNGTSG